MTTRSPLHLIGLFKAYWQGADPSMTPQPGEQSTVQGGIAHLEMLIADFEQAPSKIAVAGATIAHVNRARLQGVMLSCLASRIADQVDWNALSASTVNLQRVDATNREEFAAGRLVPSNSVDQTDILSRYGLPRQWASDRTSPFWTIPASSGPSIDVATAKLRSMSDARDLSRHMLRPRSRDGFGR